MTTKVERWKPQPKHDCPRCGGSGFIYHDDPKDHEGRVVVEHPDFGRAFPCTAPGCLQDQWNRRHEIKADIERNYGKPHTFQTFDPLPGTEKCLAAAQSVASGDLLWLLVVGQVGNGKTHLMHAVQRASNERGVAAYYSTVADLLDEYKGRIKTNDTDVMLQELKDYPLLILDDWGVEIGTDFEEGLIEKVLCYRYEARLPVAVATNKALKDVPERLRSRFMDEQMSRVVVNKAGDYRLRRKGDNNGLGI